MQFQVGYGLSNSMVQLLCQVQISLTKSTDILSLLNFAFRTMSKLKICFGPVQKYFGLLKTIWMGLKSCWTDEKTSYKQIANSYQFLTLMKCSTTIYLSLYPHVRNLITPLKLQNQAKYVTTIQPCYTKASRILG